jgi:hypothetical protein
MTKLILRYWWLIVIVLVILKRKQTNPNLIKIGYKGSHVKFINDVINKYETSSGLDDNFSKWNSSNLYNLILRDSKIYGEEYFFKGSNLKLDKNPQTVLSPDYGIDIVDGVVLEFDINWLRTKYAVN